MAERKEIAQKYKWSAEHIVAESEWNSLYDEIKRRMGGLDYYCGKLGDAELLADFFRDDAAISDDLSRIYCYAHMKHDEDTRDSKYTAMLDRANSLYVEYIGRTAFVMPELTALDSEVLKGFVGNPKLRDSDYFLKTVIRQKEHILGEKEEKLLAGMSEISSGFHDVFTMLDNADLNLPEIKEDGKKVQLTHGLYSRLMQSSDRKLRKKAFEAYYTAYKNLIHAIATAYNYNVKKDWFYAKARGYKSCLESALSGEDVGAEVYENLISSVDDNVCVLHDYIEYKKQALKVKDFYMYDMYVPVTEGARLELEYEEAYDLVEKGLAVLGEDYSALLKEARSGGWIDVCETEGKRSGAYSTSVRTCHPYVLLNYAKTAHNVFTIAHELGHAMHSYYSNKTQPAQKADYVIFVAEVASTVNEVLLLKHIIANTEDKALKKYLLEYFLEMLRTTLFRQTQFAEFEYAAHSMVERGEPITFENLSELYLSLNKKYYGAAVADDGFIKYEWARIPHFYRSFYVYKYATGIISAVTIADGILSGDKDKLAAYKKFLCSGGSDSPVELLKIAGVDLASKEPYKRAMRVFSETLEELKNS